MRLGRTRSVTAALACTAALGLTLGACQSGPLGGDASSGGSTQGASGGGDAAPAASTDPAVVTLNVARGATDVPVSTIVEVDVADGTLDDVRVTSEAGAVGGALADGGGSWVAGGGLEPGATYTVRSTATGADGETVRSTARFTTQDLTLDEQTYPSVSPLQGETVGIGMPVIVSFDLPVTDRANFERHMSVTSTPAQPGSWYWLSDNTAHWRPKKYWQSGTEVSVKVDINGVDAGNGIYGQENRDIDFTVGDANVYKVDAATHQMKVFSNGELLRTIPITTGKPGFTTRSGVKVIMEKFESKRMNSETVGIPAGSAESYDIDNVQYAMRVTNSGEFIHAAPWSTGSQGYANVSHGCTGLSTEAAGWLYNMSKRGDVVEYTGTDRGMEPGNGWTDWNVAWPEYRQGSALS